jgi:hypothetical protein
MSGRQGSSMKADVGADTAGPSNSSGVADRAVHEAVHDMFRNMAECLDGEMEGAGPHLWLLIFALLRCSRHTTPPLLPSYFTNSVEHGL